MEKKEAKGNWSSLPVLLLWMIKDKLDIFDDVRLGAVCRDWQSASSNYPKKQSIGDGIPWIMQVSKDVKSSSREFISITRVKKFTLDLPEFSDALVLFSKQGWILMRRKNLFESKQRLPDSLFLINPFTKATIEMPDVADPFREYRGSFTIHEGYPERVVLLNAGIFSQISLRTAYPGDVVWTEHYYIEQQMQFVGRYGLITIGEQVFYFDLRGQMVIFNMANQVWKELPAPENEIGRNYIMEHEGNVVKLVVSGYDCRSFSLCRYNDTDPSWEILNNDDVKDTSWYLSILHNCFSAREKGLKAHVLRPKYGGIFRGGRIICSYEVLSHDFIDGGTQTLQFPYRICSSLKWVDIG